MSKHLNILITGSSGFVGRHLASRLRQSRDVNATCTVRHTKRGSLESLVPVGDLNAGTDWSAALTGKDVVIHLAARAHVMQDNIEDPLSEYRKINVEGSLNLARQAVHFGVKRFVFLSTVKVNGEQTQLGTPFRADDTPRPVDPYALSKLEAELGLQRIAVETGLEVVIIRSPLVYGRGVKGNFVSMQNLIRSGLPLPLGGLQNKRSLIGVDNLVDFIITCCIHPAAANETFLVSDGEDLSTSDLLRRLANAMERPSRLIPVPALVLEIGAAMLGKKGIAQRLLGSLQVDTIETRKLLGWAPPFTVEEGLRRCFEDEQDSKE